MPKICNQPLPTNPFTTYRDPATGKWVVVKMVQHNHSSDPPIHQNWLSREGREAS